MKELRCKACGSNDLRLQNGYWVCMYCGTRYIAECENNHNVHPTGTRIETQNHASSDGVALSDDVRILLEKCEQEPERASKFANLILDIDPTNKEALKYL